MMSRLVLAVRSFAARHLRGRRAVAALAGVTLVVAVPGAVWWSNRPADIVIGAPAPTTSTAAPTSTILLEPTTTTAAAAQTSAGGGGPGWQARQLRAPDGTPYGPAITFTSTIPVPDRLLFVLAVGSDARPGQSVTRSRADSIHLLALDPRSGAGTVLGFPRDSWVEIPGRGQGKLTTALSLGGPDLLAETVRRLTGLPVDYYVVTGFQGFSAMVNALGGVFVEVPRRMNDKASGAFFEPGWHHFDGAEALAFSRDRKDVPGGDFGRSENHGRVLLATLAKLRAEVADDGGIARWLDVLVNHAVLTVSGDELRQLAAAARRADPQKIVNIVAPGRVGTAKRQSVVFLSPEAHAIFEDLRPDAVLGDPPPPTTTSTTSTTTTSTSTTTSTTTTTTTTSILGG